MKRTNCPTAFQKVSRSRFRRGKSDGAVVCVILAGIGLALVMLGAGRGDMPFMYLGWALIALGFAFLVRRMIWPK